MDKMVDIMQLFGGFYNRRKVLLTGHTGFKGSWLCLLLNQLGADVYGFALEPPTKPSLYNEAKVEEVVTSYIGDVRDYQNLLKVLQEVQPEIIIHMAAQALVKESYENPRETYEVNVMGTVNLLDVSRQIGSVKAIVNITSDKCYENKEWHWGYRENDALGGSDPYSNSKGCSELVTSSFLNSFFPPSKYPEHGLAIASARAGNVIGGGDWANDRLIPDFLRAIQNGEAVKIRSPLAIRPWQHVLEPLTGYLALTAKLHSEGPRFGGGWNFGPDDRDAQNVKWIISNICKLWGEEALYNIDNDPQHHEANYLKLDCSKAKAELHWAPKWDIYTALKSIVEWYKYFLRGENIRDITEQQIEKYLNQ